MGKTKDVDVKSAGDAGAGEMVKVVCNRRLSPGGRGRVIVKIDGVAHRVESHEPLTVSRELYEKMRNVEVRGVQAVVLF